MGYQPKKTMILMYPELQADLILFNGKIVTVDGENSVSKAVAVKDGRILKVGTDAQVKRMAGATTKLIDLGGKRLSLD
jgi:predicted amidohydrolase YtcJ